MVDFGTPFSGFSVDDSSVARSFYVDILGLTVEDLEGGMLQISLGGGHHVLVYPKGAAHQPASFTVLNLPAADVSDAVRDLAGRGVEFVHYDGMPQDGDGVMKGQGPDIAWFTDPAGNVMSVVGA